MKLQYTKFQIILEGVGILLLASMFIYIAVQWNDLPEKIPGHYNAVGEIDRWGSKGEILILPVVTGLLYIMLTLISRFPSVWNVPYKITDRNKEPVYQSMKDMLILLKIEMAGVFFYISIHSARGKPLSAGFTFVYISIIAGTLIASIIRCGIIGKHYR